VALFHSLIVMLRPLAGRGVWAFLEGSDASPATDGQQAMQPEMAMHCVIRLLYTLAGPRQSTLCGGDSRRMVTAPRVNAALHRETAVMRRAAALALPAVLVGLAAAAQGLPPGACHLRRYAPDHLAAHPAQSVTLIALAPETGAAEADTPVLRLSVAVRGDREIYRATAYCDRWQFPADCLLEGDAGAFRLEAARDGALRLTVAPRGISLEGSRGFVALEGTRGDDRLFLIPRAAPGACP
jgi:hypothetical protein